MDVQVKHNGTTITGFVTEYERVHKICTGIGSLSVSIVDTISRTFVPWDSIDIYENGDFKVRYYVSSIEHNVPRSTLNLDCQDNSKRIVDYFIPDSYTVDYPSYTKYWISKFLDEAGVSYEYTVDSPGTLLSNFTNLGLVTVYEQVQTLLQMSGWYMYFDGNGKAIIGTLQTELADDLVSVGKTDILNILVTKDDKMLRNKALVFGAYDAFSDSNAKASVTVHTPWNYDHRDIRTVVISNSNIPNDSTAYGMANQIVKEFSKITVEKHLTLWGARDFNLGTALRVTSNVYKGKGLVTTFGTSMSKTGLVTNVVLDERCPRLFGYFDFGDYVYVSFYGDGVWRKHIKFDPTWYNFSSGLTNLNITDLHINQGLFSAVGNSGQMYRAIDNVPWYPISVSGLMSSIDAVASGSQVELGLFSGIQARATIIDRIGNVIKYGVDTWPGTNTGDYFMTTSGMITEQVTSSGNRGWILEYDPFTGNPLGDMGSGIYPINYSGNYNIRVFDLENDGTHDFVSVELLGTGQAITTIGTDHNFGHHYTQPFISKDYTSYTVFPDAQSIEDINNEIRGSVETTNMRVQNPNALIAIDDQISGYTFAVAVGADKVARKDTFTRTFSAGAWNVTRAEVVSSAQTSIGTVLGIYPDLGADTYRIFYYKTGGTSFSSTISFYYIDWNALANTWGSESLIQTSTLPGEYTGFNIHSSTIDFIVSGNKIKFLYAFLRSNGNQYSYLVPSYLYINVITVDMELGTYTFDPILEYITEEYNGYFYYLVDTTQGDSSYPVAMNVIGNPVYFHIFQNGSDVQIIGRIELFRNPFFLEDFEYGTKEVLFYGNDTVIQTNEIYTNVVDYGHFYDGGLRRFPNQYEGNWTQLTATNAIILGYGSAGVNSYAFDGTVFFTFTSTGNSTTIPYYFKKSTVFPIFANNQNRYIARNGSTFNVCSADSLSTVTPIVPPADVYPNGFCSTGFGSFGASVYASVFIDDVDGFDWLVPFDFTSFDLGRKLYTQDDGSNSVPSFSTRTINFGDFFIANSSDYTAVQPVAGVTYIDLGTPEADAARFLVLRREGLDYTLIEEEAYPIRVDISNNSPLVTVGSGENSFVSNYVYDTELVTVEAATVSGGTSSRTVNDYRYTFIQPNIGSVSSGLGISSTILYVNGSGVFGADALNYSGGFTQMFTIPSGGGTRIETSNYGVGGQYIFVTASGFVQTFFQQDPASLGFTNYGTGFPQSRATMIRLDDVM
jgi:hypothetical protein